MVVLYNIKKNLNTNIFSEKSQRKYFVYLQNMNMIYDIIHIKLTHQMSKQKS